MISLTRLELTAGNGQICSLKPELVITRLICFEMFIWDSCNCSLKPSVHFGSALI